MLPRAPLFLALAALLLFGSAAAGVYHLVADGGAPPPAATPSREPSVASHGHPDTWTDEQVRAFRDRHGEGKVPTLTEALGLKRIPAIRILGDRGFTPANGVVGGRGTLEDPFVIDGVYADTLQLSDTTAVFELRNSYISGTLVLDWTDLGGFAHHNHVGDLRVNRNVERTGMPTAAVISDNEIGQIGQLRHFDGVLARNVVGDPLRPGLGQRVFLLDGYNGAAIVDNVVYGATEMKLHGHHHSGMHGASHNHALLDGEDHAERHHSLLVAGNTFVDPLGKGVRIHDRDHAGDDRTATSETNPALVGNHTHWTRIVVENNTFKGAGLFVDVFNAPDEYHAAPERGSLLVAGNRFVDLTGSAIRLGDAAMVDVVIRKNEAALAAVPTAKLAGIAAARLSDSTLLVEDNALDGFYYGIAARAFDENTTWRVTGLDARGAAYPVWYDDSVAHAPGDGADETPRAHEGHEHEDADAAPAATRLRIPSLG